PRSLWRHSARTTANLCIAGNEMTRRSAPMARITVVIPTYNHAQYIGEAIESALTQTRPADEILVVDNDSTDNTAQVVR
ncbi:MAG: hypothetical protein C4293_14925, partial [Nitrospiraceae bacterium]